MKLVSTIALTLAVTLSANAALANDRAEIRASIYEVLRGEVQTYDAMKGFTSSVEVGAWEEPANFHIVDRALESR